MTAGPTNQVVVDASVAVKWLLPDEDHTDRARLLLRRYGQAEIQPAPGVVWLGDYR